MTRSNRADKPNFQVELAKQRNHIAADRTLLAWIRVSVSLIGLGFILERVIKHLYVNLGIDPAEVLIPLKIFSLIFIGTGAIVVLVAAFDYRAEMKRLQQPEYYYTPRKSLGMIVSGILLAIGITIFITIIKQRLL